MPIIEKSLEVILPPHSSLTSSPSQWMGKMVAPLSSPLLTRDGILEVADRVKFIIALALLVVIAVVVRYRLASVSIIDKKPPSSSTDITTLGSPRSSHNLSDEARILNECVKEIDGKFDELFTDLKKLNQPNNLDQALITFHEKFDKVKDNPGFSTYFKAIDHIESNYRFLKTMRENLFLAPLRLTDKGIIPQPPDGNCLFHALGEGLKLLKEDLIKRGAWNEEPLDHANLRQKIVTWMKNNISTDEELQGYIDRAIGDYIEVREGQYKTEKEGLQVLKGQGENIESASTVLEQACLELNDLKAKERKIKHEWYLAKVGQPAFFASSAEMYAFSKIYPTVKVCIWRQLNGKYTSDFDAPFNESDLEVNVAYNLNGDHFDNYIPPARSR